MWKINFTNFIFTYMEIIAEINLTGHDTDTDTVQRNMFKDVYSRQWRWIIWKVFSVNKEDSAYTLNPA